jgi:biotin--protein ligase
VYIYNDAGVGPESLQQALHTFRGFLSSSCDVKTLDADAVRAGVWTRDALLFIMPGGADVPYAKALDGIGNEMIRRYVEEGGTYFGFCAGAYYGASFIEFDRGGPLQVIEKRQLRFFPGTEIGPALAPYDYKSNSGARVPVLRLDPRVSTGIHKLPAFVNGGGYFKRATAYSKVSVLAWYPGPEGRAAIVKIRVGKGFAILSGAHLEYDPYLLNSQDPYLAPLIPKLLSANADRLNWLKGLIFVR